MDPTYLLAGFTLLVALHLTIGYLTGRATPAVGPSIDDDAIVDREEGVIVCPECGAENELGYTYCHGCIEKLPGAVSRTRSGTSPGRRGIF